MPKPSTTEKASKRWCVYFVRCADGSLYAGIAVDVPKRIVIHNAGKGAKYTRSRLPVVLVWQKRRLTESEARKAEAALKRLTKAEKEAMVAKAKKR